VARGIGCLDRVAGLAPARAGRFARPSSALILKFYYAVSTLTHGYCAAVSRMRVSTTHLSMGTSLTTIAESLGIVLLALPVPAHDAALTAMEYLQHAPGGHWKRYWMKWKTTEETPDGVQP
jgi:hypothetical protein